ncbi:uncharacterized protein [Gossypium hirsutum]|uniref:Uncharacterized protein isoform X3 n=1 Tax=Gossypium hirsutum TaxID=3635 RepID=A0ABM3AZF1_GOSHI|nr:uncharacterized protein LOC107941377 isoform X3 [Gossypium hirsutum]
MILRVMYYFETLKLFSVDLTIGPMNLVLKDCDKSLSMINGSMNSQSCMLMTGQKNLVVKLVRGFWEIVGLITGQIHMMSSSAVGRFKGVFAFSDMNPYVGHQNPLKEGQELLRKGLLSEAVLALEAEIMKNPENAEGWRLLGITHAENDDDQKVIHFALVCQSWIVRVYSYTKRHCFCVL